MMTEPMKAIRWEVGDTLIRPPHGGKIGIVLIIFAYMWFQMACQSISERRDALVTLGSDDGLLHLTLLFAFFLIIFALMCAGIAWCFVGATKLFVSSDDLIVRHCIAGMPIFTSTPIKLSIIGDVLIQEKEFKGEDYEYHIWILIVHVEDGSTRQVVTFYSSIDADAFMRRHVRFA